MAMQSRADRRTFRAPGWIGGNGNSLMPCFILDVSKAGAKLAVKEASTVPQNLRLYLSPTAQTYRRCVVRWRNHDSVGIQFEKQSQ
jgi:hypothetical protein